MRGSLGWLGTIGRGWGVGRQDGGREFVGSVLPLVDLNSATQGGEKFPGSKGAGMAAEGPADDETMSGAQCDRVAPNLSWRLSGGEGGVDSEAVIRAREKKLGRGFWVALM